MKKSPVDGRDIFSLIKNALTTGIDDREIFMKGIDYSYYYEEIDEEEVHLQFFGQINDGAEPLFRKSELKYLLQSELLWLISMCVLFYRSTLVAIFCDVSNKDKIMNSLDFKLDIIQKGVKEKLKEIIDGI